MPRKEVVSRTMPVTISNVMCVDLDKGILINKDFITKGSPISDSGLERKLNKECARKGFKFVKLISYTTETRTGKMTIEEFIDHCTWK